MTSPVIIRGVRKNMWLRNRNPKTHYDWLTPGDIVADVLKDISTKDGKLSVWLIENEARIVTVGAAINCTREGSAANFDYVKVEYQKLTSNNFILESEPGETPIENINTLHRNITQLTTKKISELAEILLSGEFNRILKSEIVNEINNNRKKNLLNVESEFYRLKNNK